MRDPVVFLCAVEVVSPVQRHGKGEPDGNEVHLCVWSVCGVLECWSVCKCVGVCRSVEVCVSVLVCGSVLVCVSVWSVGECGSVL